MRILTKEQAKKIDFDFVYGDGNVVAIVGGDFEKMFGIVPKKRSEHGRIRN